MSDKRVIWGFNLIAPYYDFFVALFFQKRIQHCQNYFLNTIEDAQSVLIFGGGTGDILLSCLEVNPGASYHYIDISERMIELTKQKVNSTQINFITGSIRDIPKGNFEVIITPFVLDCFTNASLKTEVIPQLKAHMASKGKWIFSDFSYRQAPSKRFVSKLIIRSLYFVFNLLCGLGVKKLPHFNACFASHGLTTLSKKDFASGLLTTCVYEQVKTNKN
ncbi:class I SAM-dependent methyltransferase [Flavobacteriales bacterium]|nr:class I SAM-dependent methyltransferase [Flavobacteriales bacterium]